MSNQMLLKKSKNKLVVAKRFLSVKKNNFVLNSFLLGAFCLLFLTQAYGQSISVSGRITSARFPVQNASVTFIDNADTSRKFIGVTNSSGNYQVDIILTSVGTGDNSIPSKFALGQNYPNPFASSTAIPYEVKEKMNVEVTIYDILGREVRKFEVGEQATGTHNILWDGRNSLGHEVASGIYFYRLHADGESLVKKMILNQGSKGMVSLPKSSYSGGILPKTNEIGKAQASNFTIRIGNTINTFPYVITQEIKNVEIQNDTSISFTVDNLPTASINTDSLHQTIRGFGAANILPWRPDMTNSEIETAFGTGEGQLGFSILRLMIQPDKNQWSMNVAAAKKAYDMGAIIFASPWNVPDNMAEVVDGQTRVRHDMYAEYAAHLDSFNTYMNSNGVPLYAISVQNEPDFAEDWTGWTPEEMLTFMKENADDIGTRVMAPESFQFRRNMSDPLLNDSVALANLDIVGGHIYGGGLAKYPLAKQKGKEVWMTEHLTGENSHSNDWNWALDVAEEMNSVMASDMSAYVWWYIVRYYGPISDGEKQNEGGGRKGEVTKKGYVMSQFARFIRPGYYRVESISAPPLSSVGVTAYKDTASGRIVIVAVNSGSDQAETIFRVQDPSFSAAFTPYTTSESKNCEEGNTFNMSEGIFSFTLEPESITTFVSE